MFPLLCLWYNESMWKGERSNIKLIITIKLKPSINELPIFWTCPCIHMFSNSIRPALSFRSQKKSRLTRMIQWWILFKMTNTRNMVLLNEIFSLLNESNPLLTPLKVTPHFKWVKSIMLHNRLNFCNNLQIVNVTNALKKSVRRKLYYQMNFTREKLKKIVDPSYLVGPISNPPNNIEIFKGCIWCMLWENISRTTT